MKILHTVESYLPSRHGMSEVVRQLSERLAAKGHQVTVVTKKDPDRHEKVISGVEIVEFDISGNITESIEGESDHYKQYLLNSDFDIVTNFAAQQWATDLALPILSKIRGKKVFVPTGYSGLYLDKYKQYYHDMGAWLKKYDKVVYLSENYRDVKFARNLGLTNGVLIPNGASEKEFSIEKDIEFRKRFGIPEHDLLILHVAGFVGAKGHMDAIKIFIEAKLNQASLVFVSPEFGYSFNRFNIVEKQNLINLIKFFIKPEQLSEVFNLQIMNFLKRFGFFRSIYFLKLARNDVIQAYLNSDLLLFPSQIECSPIVLFESMAAKTPFLVTDVGNSCEIVEWSKAGVILPTIISNEVNGLRHADIVASSKILKRIASNTELRQLMAQSGNNSWIKNFTWEKISQEYEELYKSLLNH